MKEEEIIKKLEEAYNQLEKDRALLQGVIIDLSYLKTELEELIGLVAVSGEGD
jgi:hypothetical protein